MLQRLSNLIEKKGIGVLGNDTAADDDSVSAASSDRAFATTPPAWLYVHIHVESSGRGGNCVGHFSNRGMEMSEETRFRELETRCHIYFYRGVQLHDWLQEKRTPACTFVTKGIEEFSRKKKCRRVSILFDMPMAFTGYGTVQAGMQHLGLPRNMLLRYGNMPEHACMLTTACTRWTLLLTHVLINNQCNHYYIALVAHLV